jgi:hypothetical protein
MEIHGLKIVKLLQCEKDEMCDESLKMNVFETKTYFEMKSNIVDVSMVVGAMEYNWQCEVYFIISFSLSVHVQESIKENSNILTNVISS